jgi:hypothetical protein
MQHVDQLYFKTISNSFKHFWHYKVYGLRDRPKVVIVSLCSDCSPAIVGDVKVSCLPLLGPTFGPRRPCVQYECIYWPEPQGALETRTDY